MKMEIFCVRPNSHSRASVPTFISSFWIREACFCLVFVVCEKIASPFQYLLLSIISETPADDFYDDLPNNHSHLYFASFLPPSVCLLRVLMFPTRSAFRTSFHLIFLKAANIYCSAQSQGGVGCAMISVHVDGRQFTRISNTLLA